MDTLKARVKKELDYGMDMPERTDIVFVGIWVSRRLDGSLDPTMCQMADEPLTDELRKQMVNGLRNMADRLVLEGWGSQSVT